MSTPNFCTQDNFPLYCIDDSGWDWPEAQEFYAELDDYLENINEKLTFFKITVRGGYYAGAQFYVEISRYADEAGFDLDGATRWADNESTRYYLDMCLSEAKRKFETEQRKVLRLLDRTGAEFGFEKYFCRAIFSSGEAIYEKVQNTARSRARQAVSPVA